MDNKGDQNSKSEDDKAERRVEEEKIEKQQVRHEPQGQVEATSLSLGLNYENDLLDDKSSTTTQLNLPGYFTTSSTTTTTTALPEDTTAQTTTTESPITSTISSAISYITNLLPELPESEEVLSNVSSEEQEDQDRRNQSQKEASLNEPDVTTEEDKETNLSNPPEEWYAFYDTKTEINHDNIHTGEIASDENTNEMWNTSS